MAKPQPRTRKTQMEMEWTNVTRFRERLFQMLEALEERPVAITRNGKPLAVLVDFEEFQYLKALAERLEDEALTALARERLKLYEDREIQSVPLDELFK
jgi:prevent-host-death family protein